MSTRKGTGGPAAIGRKLPKSVIAGFRKRGFAKHEILTRWPEIVGPELAAASLPERLNWRRGELAGATLVLRADRAVALKIQADWPRIRERINRFYGYRAVDRLKLVQGPVPAGRDGPKVTVRPMPPTERDRLREQLAPLCDSPLKTALTRLGESVVTRSASAPSAAGEDTKA